MAFDYTNYYELEYLESSGNQYISTSIAPNTIGRIRTEVKFKSTSRQMLLASWNKSYNAYMVQIGYHKDLGYWTHGISPSAYTDGTIINTTDYYVYDLNLNAGNLKINGSTVQSTSGYASSNRALYIFASNDADEGVYLKASAYLKYLEIYNKSGNLSYNFIPAERKSDGVLGLYETVNGTFYTNAGSGTFISGGRIQYVITSNVTPTGSGYVSGTGSFYKNETTTLVATANTGYVFQQWSDGVLTDTRTIIVTEDATYTAVFYVPISITLVYDSNYGTASYVWSGTDIVLTATPNKYGTFNGWYINNVLQSTSNPYTYTPTQDITIEARFSAKYSWIDPIVNRTQADITAKNSKAYINYGDLNRIEKDTAYLCYILHEDYPDLDNIVFKTNWTRTDIPSVNNMERIRANAETILRTLHSTDSIQTFGNQFNFENANDIEGALLTIYEEVNNA